MGTATVNGIEINFEDSGGSGPAVLFSHGFLMDHSMFDQQVAEFAADYRCIRWDERGFGRTAADGPFSYWDSASDAIGVLDTLEIEQAILVGMSQGGFLTLRAALAAPERVAGVALLGSAADLDDEATIEGYRQMLGAMTGGDDDIRAAVMEQVAGLILADPGLEAQWMPRWAEIDAQQLLWAGGALLERDDLSQRAAEISCPVVAVHGGADQAITPDRAQALVNVIPDHRGVTVVPGAAHAVNMSHPDETNPVLAEFLRSVS